MELRTLSGRLLLVPRGLTGAGRAARVGAWAGAAMLLSWAAPGVAWAQVRIVEDAPAGSVAPSRVGTDWGEQPAEDAGLSPDQRVIRDARRAIAGERPSEAKSLLDEWLERNEGSGHELLAEAYYLRGVAKLAMDDEFDALYDFEEVVNNHPGSEFFVSSLERELDVARLYLAGRKRPGLFGLRFEPAGALAEEIIIRVCERLPGSKLAEQALIELGDYYARERDLRMAVETYDTFVRLYDRSRFRQLAMERRIYASVAQFRGPSYDATMLRDAQVWIGEFQRDFPDAAQRAGLTDALSARLDESRAQAMLENARWYLKRRDPVAARVVLARLVDRFPRTGAAHDAVTLLEDLSPQTPSPTGADASEEAR